MRCLLGFLALLFPLLLLAQEAELQQQLSAHLEGKTVFLRGFPQGEALRYDATGEPLRPLRTGSWTLEGALRVQRVRLQKGRLVIEGERQGLIYDREVKQLTFLPSKQVLKLEIARPAEDDLNAVERTLGRVFVRGEEEMAEVVPSHWRLFFRHYRDDLPWSPPRPRYDPEAGPRLVKRGEMRPRPPRPEPEPLPDGTPVLSLSGRVRPPLLISTEASRQIGITGDLPSGSMLLVASIDREGRPHNVRVEEPYGLGLEEEAVTIVERSRYTPGTLDGEPVAVEIGIRIEVQGRR